MAAKENTDPDVVDFRKKWKVKQAGCTRTCFKEPMTDSEMSVISKCFVPASTQKNSAWALGVFLDWRAERNRKAALTRIAARERNVRSIFWTPQIS